MAKGSSADAEDVKETDNRNGVRGRNGLVISSMDFFWYWLLCCSYLINSKQKTLD